MRDWLDSIEARTKIQAKYDKKNIKNPSPTLMVRAFNFLDDNHLLS